MEAQNNPYYKLTQLSCIMLLKLGLKWNVSIKKMQKPITVATEKTIRIVQKTATKQWQPFKRTKFQIALSCCEMFSWNNENLNLINHGWSLLNDVFKNAFFTLMGWVVCQKSSTVLKNHGGWCYTGILTFVRLHAWAQWSKGYLKF